MSKYISYFKKHRALTSIALPVLTILITISISEIFIFYILDIKPIDYKPDRFFQSSLLTGHFHKPNSQGYWYSYDDGSKYHVSINKFGFSDSDRKLEKARPRIALIGDSTTEFWEMKEEYRGQYVIEEKLNEKYEVLNMGVRGFGTDQTYILFKNIGIHFQPDVVIYFFCINDIHDNATHKSKPYFVFDPISPDKLLLQGYPVEVIPQDEKNVFSVSGLEYLLAEHSYFWRNARHAIKRLVRLLGFHQPYPIEEHFDLRPYLKNYTSNDQSKIDLSLEIISAMNKFVEDNGMKFLLVEGLYRPAFSGRVQDKIIESYGDIFNFDKVSNVLFDFSKERGIEFLSLPRLARNQGIDMHNFIHEMDVMHLNRHGALFYAESIVTKLHSLGWLEK